MDKRIRFTSVCGRNLFVSRVRFGDVGSCPIDQAPAKSFNVDPATGRPMSDIQRIVKMQNDLAQQNAFAALNEFKTNYLPEGVSDDDALKFMCPRLSQLPSELLSYKDGLVKYQLEQQKAAEERKLAEQQAKEYQDYLVSLNEKETKSD